MIGMEIGYSEPTLLLGIIRQAQEIASEGRWIEHYAHTPAELECVEDCIHNIEDCLVAIKENFELLKSEKM